MVRLAVGHRDGLRGGVAISAHMAELGLQVRQDQGVIDAHLMCDTYRGPRRWRHLYSAAVGELRCRRSGLLSRMETPVTDLSGNWVLHRGEALDAYPTWPAPSTIVSDGAYGVGGFHGDPRTPEGLAEWYAPHVEAWSRHSTLATTLWFWSTEVGWANVHPLLIANGWHYEFINVWNKGIGHVAGNVNGRTIRRFPTVTEVCAFYTREPRFPSAPGSDTLVHARNGCWPNGSGLAYPFVAQTRPAASRMPRSVSTSIRAGYGTGRRSR